MNAYHGVYLGPDFPLDDDFQTANKGLSLLPEGSKKRHFPLISIRQRKERPHFFALGQKVSVGPFLHISSTTLDEKKGEMRAHFDELEANGVPNLAIFCSRKIFCDILRLPSSLQTKIDEALPSSWQKKDSLSLLSLPSSWLDECKKFARWKGGGGGVGVGWLAAVAHLAEKQPENPLFASKTVNAVFGNAKRAPNARLTKEKKETNSALSFSSSRRKWHFPPLSLPSSINYSLRFRPTSLLCRRAARSRSPSTCRREEGPPSSSSI